MKHWPSVSRVSVKYLLSASQHACRPMLVDMAAECRLTYRPRVLTDTQLTDAFFPFLTVKNHVNMELLGLFHCG